MIKKIDKTVKSMTWAMFCFAATMFLLVMLLVVVDVTLRKIRDQGIIGSYEIASVALLCGVFTAWSFAQTEHHHVRVSMFLLILPKKLRMILNAVANVIGFVALVCVVYAAILQIRYALENSTQSGILGIPQAPLFVVEAIAMVVFAIAVLWDAIRSFAALKDDELYAEIQKDWV